MPPCACFPLAPTGRTEETDRVDLFYVAIYAVVYFFALDKLYGLLQLCVVLAIPLLALYNGKRGKNPAVNKVRSGCFYIYYPLHLAVLGFIQLQIR